MVNHYYCTLVTYVISYSYYTSIKKKKDDGGGAGAARETSVCGNDIGEGF